jgi:hypothetical protein
MPNRYNLSLTNLGGVTTTVQITKVGTTGDDPADVLGNVVLTSDRLNNPRENIRQRGAELFLEADAGQTYADLFTEQPRQWRVVVTRAGQVIFDGWIENDTVVEDYVNAAWITTFKANDGLKDLSNVGYARSDGNPYTGNTTLRTVLLNCLEKSGQFLDVGFVQTLSTNTDYPVRARTSPPTSGEVFEDYFDQTIDQQSFIQDDGVTPRRVLDVMRDILFGANAFICQQNGGWYVTWLLQIPSSIVAGSLDYKRFDYQGNALVAENLNIGLTLGSQLDGFEPHWAEENQRLERKPSLGTAKAVYIFGPLGDILENNEFVNNGTTLLGWTINQAGSVTLNADPVNTLTLGLAVSGETNPALTSDTSVVTVRPGQTIKWRALVSPNPPDLQFYLYRQRVRIIYQETVGGSQTWYLDENNFWTTTAKRIELNATVNLAPDIIEFGFDTLPIPEGATEGTLQFLIYPVDDDSGSPSYVTSAEWLSLSIGAVNLNDDATQFGAQGQRITTPSPVTYDPQPVNLGDAVAGVLYRSTLLLNAGVTISEFGYRRPTIPLSDSTLYEATVVDLLILQSSIAKFFSGGVFGYVPYLSRITIDGLTGVFMVTGWSFDIGRDTCELKLWEVFFLSLDILDPDPFFTDYEVQPVTTQSGQTIKPVIRG